MRTTLDIDEDAMLAAKALSAQRGISLGKAISELIRQAILTSHGTPSQRNGIPLLPRREGVVVTMELVNRLRDEDDTP